MSRKAWQRAIHSTVDNEVPPQCDPQEIDQSRSTLAEIPTAVEKCKTTLAEDTIPPELRCVENRI